MRRRDVIQICKAVKLEESTTNQLSDLAVLQHYSIIVLQAYCIGLLL